MTDADKVSVAVLDKPIDQNCRVFSQSTPIPRHSTETARPTAVTYTSDSWLATLYAVSVYDAIQMTQYNAWSQARVISM